MYCERVITGVRYCFGQMPEDEIPSKNYIVLEGAPEEALAFMAQLRGNPDNMQNMVEWLMPEYRDAYVLLITYDGKEGLIYPKTAIDNPTYEEHVHFLGTEDNYFPNELKRLVRDFKNFVENDPVFAEKIGYVIPPKPIKRRIVFEQMLSPLYPGDLIREIDSAARNLESATDDALVWMVIIGPKWRGWNNVDYQRVLNEIELRQLKHEAFLPRFFPLNKVSIEEMLARQARVRVTYQKFLNAFPGIGLDFHDHESTEKWTQKLDNDRLAELAVCLFFAGDMEDLWKLVVGVLHRRYPNNQGE